MRNKTRGFTVGFGSRRAVLCWALLALMLAAGAWPAVAANRRFLVILANPPKTFSDTGGDPPQGFANPALVHGQYFDDNPNNAIYSMAEWWDEISYGAVTVSGETYGWLNLPWPLEPPPDPDGGDGATLSPEFQITLGFDGEYTYGLGEPFVEDPMPYLCNDPYCDGIAVDYNGDEPAGPGLGFPHEAYGGSVLTELQDIEDCRCCSTEGTCEDYSVDSNQDGQVDACDTEDQEAPNDPCPVNTCCSPVGCLALCLGGDDCGDGEVTAPQCLAQGGTPVLDASTECVVPCTTCPPVHLAIGRLGKLARGPNIPSLPLVDGIYTPGERFRDANGNGRFDALHEPPADVNEDGICDYPGDGDLGDQDYLDLDDDGQFDRPEPFEDHLVRWDPFAFSGEGDWVPVTEAYIRSNYPLNQSWNLEDALDDFLLTQFGYSCDIHDLTYWNSDPYCLYIKIEMYRLRGLGYFPDDDPDALFQVNWDAVAAWTNVDEMVWRTGNGVYDPPERFRDARDDDEEAEEDARVTTKMQLVPEGADPWVASTPPPGSGPGLDYDNPSTTADDQRSWYEDFWRGRYGTKPPAWAKGVVGRNIPRMTEFDLENPNPNWAGDERNPEGQRKFWSDAGQPDENPSNPALPLTGDVEPDSDVGFYDGWVEHDDLASSKYHAFGDQRLGEVTSPFNDAIWGQDRGLHYPSSPADSDDIIVAAGPLAENIHGTNRLDAGDVLMLEYMTWRTDTPYIDPGRYYDAADACPDPFHDCNGNGIPDEQDLADGTLHDDLYEETAGDGIPDECQVEDNCDDDPDDVINFCEITCDYPCDSLFPGLCGQQTDCDGNGLPDNCDPDCNNNDIPDNCEDFAGAPSECLALGLTVEECVIESGVAFGIRWDDDRSILGGDWSPHPYAGPSSGLGFDMDGDGSPDTGYGFRDYNLDGLVDQGEVRPAGSENYVADGLRDTPNNGTNSRYPWNRRRVLEDCIEILDRSLDFDIWHDVNSPVYGGPQPADAAGIVSGIVLFPPDALSGHDLFPTSPLFYPIHTNDREANATGPTFRLGGGGGVYQLSALDPTVPDRFYSDLWFHDLVAGMDRGTVSGSGAGGAAGSGGVRYQMRYAAHEYGHAWEGYPDLYDYRRLQADPGETFPIGYWCTMADGDRDSGYPVHVVADLKRISGWIDPVDLTTVLSPGVEQEVTFADAELSNNDTYYYYQNPLLAGERFYFWRAGFAGQFDLFLHGSGLLILHTDLGTNPDAVPSQQQLNPYTWYIVQADGQYQLDAPLPAGNLGDAGDPWPGFGGSLYPFGNTRWGHTTVPNNRWHGSGFSGVDVMDIMETATGTRVTFRWTPTEVPVLAFDDPPAAMSGALGRITYQSYDQYAGTTLKFYYDTDDEGYNGTLIGQSSRSTAGILEPGSITWNLSPGGTPIADDLYYLYAKLVPGPGQDGTESAFSSVRASRNNLGNGTVSNISVDPAKVKLEAWTMTCTDMSGQIWQVEGSLSGIQTSSAHTGQTYTSAGGGVTFKINAGSIPFFVDDQFVFVTTGFTPYVGPVNVVGGRITNKPIARICDTCAQPLSGDPPLTVEFDGRASDPNGARDLLYAWAFGEGEGTASGAQVTHTYERPGTFVVILTVTDIDDPNKFDSAEVEIRVKNGKPTAVITAVSLSPMNEFPFSIQFFGNESTDPEDLPLTFAWSFTGPLPEHNKTSNLMDPPVQTYFEDPAHPGKPYTEDVVARLVVTDSAGETDVAEYRFRPGNVAPVARFSVTPISGTAPLTVTVDASASTDGDPDQTLTYNWDFGDPGGTGNTATGKTTSHTYKDPGTYKIKLTVSDGITNSTAEATVVALDSALVGETPTALFVATPTSGNAPLTVEFDASNSSDPQNDPLTYEWDFGDGDEGNGMEVSHTYELCDDPPCNYTATLTATDPDGNSGTFQVVITVRDPFAATNQPPTSSFTAEPTEGPAPLTVTFTSTATDPDSDSLDHLWDFGDTGEDNTASGIEATHTYAAAGTYTATLKVSDPQGLTDSADQTIEVFLPPNNPPVARVATTPATVTAPDEVTFDGNLSSDPDGDSLVFTWEISSDGIPLVFENELVGARLLVSFRNTDLECSALSNACLTPGSYSVELTADDGRGGTDTYTRDVKVQGGTGGVIIDEEAGAGVPGGQALTGSARITRTGPCGIGTLIPSLFLGLAMGAWSAGRRRWR